MTRGDVGKVAWIGRVRCREKRMKGLGGRRGRWVFFIGAEVASKDTVGATFFDFFIRIQGLAGRLCSP